VRDRRHVLVWAIDCNHQHKDHRESQRRRQSDGRYAAAAGQSGTFRVSSARITSVTAARYLPTAHGFDEYAGVLYHLNALEEPEDVDYPRNPEFFAKYGPRDAIYTCAPRVATA